MKKSYCIVGDIAGRYQELLRLLDKMPDGIPVSVGDMIDRGPDSKRVLDFFQKPNHIAVLGNHEHQLVDIYRETRFYDVGIWWLNGGWSTLMSFCEGYEGTVAAYEGIGRIPQLIKNYYNKLYVSNLELEMATKAILPFVRRMIPESYIEWLDNLPLHFMLDDLIVTHAPINPSVSFSRALNLGESAGDMVCDTSVIWNRGGTRRRFDGRFQVHGHISRKNPEWYKDKMGAYGINLDTSGGKKLSGLHWPSMQIYEQEYLS